ncbi:MAG: ATP-binding protein [Bacteroidales bacterium]|nr:ATP-binding protein [Bacteroidales bacterium]
MNKIFHDYLIGQGVSNGQIIQLDLDDSLNARYRNPLELDTYLREQLKEKATQYYILLDEIQKVKPVPNPYLKEDRIGFVDILNGLKNLTNVDVYVTGSNSKMLSTDIATEFRGRGDLIAMSPLTYDEFYAAYSDDKKRAWREFFTYGGMPKILSLKSHEEKAKYLFDLFNHIYIKDILERYNLKADEAVLNDLLNVISSAVGSLTNPSRIADTFQSVKKLKIKNETISRYLDCFVEAFLLHKALRFNIKGRSYIETPLKYYFTDIGLRNAKINFRQQEENHIMENILFNELKARGFSVDIGVVEYNHKNAEGKNVCSQLEVDFVVNKGDLRYYIQSALTVDEESKRLQEVNSLNRIDDSFTKIVVVKDDIIPWTDDRGIQYINIEDFLLNKIDHL